MLRLDRELFLQFAAGKTELYLPDLVRNVVIGDLSIRLDIEGHTIDEVRYVYENRFPDHALDLLRLEWAYRCRVENVGLFQAGRHALVFENALACQARGMVVDGAWNKGKGGNGYVRLARAYGCLFGDNEVRNIRHITLQWSAAYNLIDNIDSQVDVNIHGGYPHHNLIQDCRFHIPSEHPWQPITRAPADAAWAPPNGPENLVERIQTDP